MDEVLLLMTLIFQNFQRVLSKQCNNTVKVSTTSPYSIANWLTSYY